MSASGIRFTLVLPCFNELEHIGDSLREIREFLRFAFPLSDYEILLVDDGSNDGTREFLSGLELGPELRLIFHPENRGRGAAVKTGFQNARGVTVGFMDIDREVSEVYLTRFIQVIESGADLAVASRTYVIRSNPYEILRHLASVSYRRVVAWRLKSKLDTEAGFKFFSSRARDLVLKLSRNDDWFWDTESVLLISLYDYSIQEVPVLFRRANHKTSTVQLWRDIPRYLRALARFEKERHEGLYGDGSGRGPKTPGLLEATKKAAPGR